MRLIDLDQTIFVPIVDETRGGVEYEMEMTVGEFFEKFFDGCCPETVDAIPVVRCAYCKYCFDMGSDPMEPYDGESEWYCERFDRDTSAYEIDPYRFFCADGERRDDDASRRW